ncbi:hypothetical protein LINGRAHAP2_LOCUS19955, partial [Linum grandiflorum]
MLPCISRETQKLLLSTRSVASIHVSRKVRLRRLLQRSHNTSRRRTHHSLSPGHLPVPQRSRFLPPLIPAPRRLHKARR